MGRANVSGHKEDLLEDFSTELQELIVRQARKILNLTLYTRALLSTLPVALIATDKYGCIQTVNQAAEEILGIEEKELQGRRLTELFEPGSEPAVRIPRSLTEGEPFHLRSENLRLTSKKELVGNLYFQPFKDEEEDICGLLLTVEDQTYVHYLSDAFKRYVPPSVSEMIAKNPQALKLGGEEKTLSVLFCDLKDFTRYAESFPPHEMVTILSDYFAEMTEQVFAWRGTLKEYVGDELMAIFGAPVEQTDHAERACAAALKMQDRLRSLRESWASMGRPPLTARIGINSGPMLVGNLGSPYRFSYGVIGDQVNLGSRLEGLAELYGVEILIGENTADLVGEAFLVREVDSVKVKGSNQTVRIYELVAPSDIPIPGKKAQALKCYAEGLETYRRRRWNASIEHFSRALTARPNDSPSSVMLERCHTYLKAPPPKDWEGVFQHTKKR